MKKIVILFLNVFMVSCAFLSPDEEEFKNPLFDLPLEPLSTTNGYAYIYPTLIDYRGVIDENRIIAVGKCKMFENKMDRVTLKCQIKYDLDAEFREPNYHTFILKEKMHKNCIRVEEQIRELNAGYGLDAPLSSVSSYCIRIPEDLPI